MQNLINNKSGFSLIELIIYLAILFIVAGVLFQFAISMVSNSAKNKAIDEVGQNLQLSVDKLFYEIRNASGVNVGSSVFGAHPGVLSLAKSVPADDPTVISVSGGRLQAQFGASSPVFLTTEGVEVTNLVFRDLSVSGKTQNIQVDLTIKYLSDGGSGDLNWEDSRTFSAALRKF